MKPTYLKLGLALLFLLLIACQKTDSSSTTTNYFKIDDQRHDIEKAAFVNIEDNPVLKDMKVLLFISDGLSFDANSNRELKIRWFLFDQILISYDLMPAKGVFFIEAKVFSPDFLKNKKGRYKGYPFRSEIHGGQLSGYSDHFPIYAIMGKMK